LVLGYCLEILHDQMDRTKGIDCIHEAPQSRVA
jgi:hypothetical protein